MAAIHLVLSGLGGAQAAVVVPQQYSHYGLITNGSSSAENTTSPRQIEFLGDSKSTYMVLGTFGNSFTDTCNNYVYNPVSFFSSVYDSTNNTQTSATFFNQIALASPSTGQDINSWVALTPEINFNGPLVDSADRVYTSGYVYRSANGVYQFWSAQFSPTGALNWANTYVHTVNTSIGPVQMAVHPSTGDSYTGASLSTTPFDTILFKQNSAGTVQWRYRYTGTARRISQLAVDAGGNVFMGSTGTANIAYIHKLDSSGNAVNSVSINGTSASILPYLNLQVSPVDGYLYAFMSQNGTSAGYVMKFDASLNLIWQQKLTIPLSTYAQRVAFDGDGNVYFLTGDASLASAYAIKMSPSGTLLWARQYSTASGFASFRGASVSGAVLFSVWDRTSTRNLGIHSSQPIDGTKTGAYNVPTGTTPTTYTFGWSALTVTVTAGDRTIAAATVPTRAAETAFTATAQTITTTTGNTYPFKGSVAL